VAGEPERRWNQSLQRVTELEEAVGAVVVEPGLSAQECEELMALGSDLALLEPARQGGEGVNFACHAIRWWLECVNPWTT
jgi:hypothetical protein